MSKQVLIYSVVKQEKYSVTPEVHFFESTRVALKYSGKKKCKLIIEYLYENANIL